MSANPKSFERTLQLTSIDTGDVRDIVVRLGYPERDPAPGGDHRVLIEIDGFDQPYSRYFHGVDELQALLSGSWLVPKILPSLVPAGARLTWLGQDDLGFEIS
ncbi:MAG: hypothetical protein ABI193_16705 [Minicystis sp.]